MAKQNKDWAPDFIGIGVMKSASYWIYKCLEQHPDICVSSRKELHFFNTHYDEGFDWYESFFNHCKEGNIQGEFTPNYIYSPEAAELIHKYNPNVKLLACLRNPIDRAYSHYRFNVTRKGQMSLYDGFEHAMNEDSALVDIGLYHQQLTHYYELFPSENILIVLFDDMKRDPVKFMENIYAFLGVDSSFVSPVTTENLGSTGTRLARYRIPLLNPIMYKIADWVRGSFIDRLFIRSGIKKRLNRLAQKNKQMYDAKPGEEITFPPLDAEARENLLQKFSDDIKQLEKLTGLDLSAWLSSSGGRATTSRQ